MLKNYLTSYIRHFLKYKNYAIINMGGLVVGLLVSILVFLWVLDEIRVDAFHQDGDRIYRVFNNYESSNGQINTGYTGPGPLSETLVNEVPEVETAIRLTQNFEASFQYDSLFFTQRGYYADPDFFNVFTFSIIQGDPVSPLPIKNSIVISRDFAGKLFKGENPIGKILRLDDTHDLKVTGVFENPPVNSSLKFDYVIPFDIYYDGNNWLREWNSNGIYTYVKLKESSSLENVNQKLNELFRKNCQDCKNQSFLFPFSDIYLHSVFENGKSAGGRIEYVRIFMFVAVFILLMACINFTNLATARSAMRSKEVGVRKAAGAGRRSLIKQFIGESVLQAFCSLGIALLLAKVLLPFFNVLINKKNQLQFSDPIIILIVAGVTLLTGLLAGSYPALYLSSIKPMTALRNQGPVSSKARLRESLVVFQFILSTIMIACSLTVYNQVDFIRSRNLGFEKDNILTFGLGNDGSKNVTAFKTEAAALSGIESVGLANNQPFKVTRFWNEVNWPGKPQDEIITFHVIACDEDFIPTLKMEIVEGRNYEKGDASNALNFIVNEAAVAVMGLKNPIGTSLTTGKGEGKIIGVVKDFHNVNIRSEINPLILTYNSESPIVFVRVNSSGIEKSLTALDKVYKKYNASHPFEYSFLSDNFNREYTSEVTMGKLSIFFAGIAIFISCLGLYGLISFTTERKTREISLRKIMGASFTNIITLLCSDFMKLIGIALMLGCPIAYLLADKFISGYAYHLELDFLVIIIPVMIIVGLAFTTMIFKSIKASLGNPVHALRSE